MPDAPLMAAEPAMTLVSAAAAAATPFSTGGPGALNPGRLLLPPLLPLLGRPLLLLLGGLGVGWALGAWVEPVQVAPCAVLPLLLLGCLLTPALVIMCKPSAPCAQAVTALLLPPLLLLLQRAPSVVPKLVVLLMALPARHLTGWVSILAGFMLSV